MFVGFLFVVFYIALQTFHNTIRIRNITSALASLSKAIAASGNVPVKNMDEVNAQWDKAKTRMNEATAVMGVMMVAIIIFLLALGRQGHF